MAAFQLSLDRQINLMYQLKLTILRSLDWFMGGQPLGETLTTDAIEVTGDEKVFERFLSLFPLPKALPSR